ncbi:helix-turn-helix transcriptional regulator [Actinomadura coerulea]|uniref:helix-turn-helix transcriptional regulator n=1 Tax=Actinomadura coerulea TaxID=46159 RepID=UPI00342C6115
MAVVQAGCPLCGCRAPHTDGRALPLRLAQAMTWLRDHYGDPGAGVTAMAEAAQVRVRQLQNLCDTHLDTTPSQLIRDVRLHQARTALLNALPGQVRIADIAAQVGFISPSGFAARHSARYGELPSTILRHASSGMPWALSATPHQPVWARLEQEQPAR